MSTQVTSGVDPLPGKPVIDDHWATIQAGHTLVYLGSRSLLDWTPGDGKFKVWRYDPAKAGTDVDPFDPEPISSGEWSTVKDDQPEAGDVHALVHLEQRLVLDWIPKKGSFRTWKVDPDAKEEPLPGPAVAEGTWTTITDGHRLVYLGRDWVLDWVPTASGADFRVFRLDRLAKHEPLPGPAVTAGSWASVNADHELVYLGLDQVLDWEPKTGQYRVWKVDRFATGSEDPLPGPSLAEGKVDFGPGDQLVRMDDHDRLLWFHPPDGHYRILRVADLGVGPTSVAGVELRRKTGDARIFVVVRIGALFPGNAPPTILGLANRLGMTQEQLFRELLELPENAHVIPALHAKELGGKFPGAAAAVRQLRQAGTRFTATGQGKHIYTTSTPYEGWGVQPPDDKPVWFSLGPAIRDVLEAASGTRSRESRITTSKPIFERLQKRLTEIQVVVQNLEIASSLIKSASEKALADAALLEGLTTLLELMLAEPKDPAKFSDSDRAEVTTVRDKVRALAAEHLRATVEMPPLAEQEVKDRARLSAELLALIEVEELVSDTRFLRDHEDVCPTDLWNRAYDLCRRSYLALLVGPEEQKVVDGHVTPMLQALALRVTRPTNTGHKGFDEEMVKALASPTRHEWLEAMADVSGKGALVAGPTALTLGNVNGPQTLFVAVAQLAAPGLITRAADPDKVGRTAAWLARALFARSGLPIKSMDIVAQAAKGGTLKPLRAIDWTKYLQSNAAWSGAYSLVQLVCLCAAITTYDANTPRKVANIVASGAGTGAALSSFATSFMRSAELMSVAGRVTSVGKFLGVVGSLASMGSGALTAAEEYGAGDKVGFTLGVVTAASGAFSAAGFLIATGAATSWVGGAGTVLMAAGAAIGLGAAVVSTVRGLTTNKTHGVIEAGLAAYEQGGPYAVARDVRPALKAALEAAKTAHHPGITGFMPYLLPWRPPGVAGVCHVFDAGFERSTVQMCVDEAQDLVDNELRARGRIS